MTIKYNKDFLAMLDAPWLKRQVETHLFFGLCSRTLPFALLYLTVYSLIALYILITSVNLFEKIQYLFFLVVGFFLLKLSKYHQAVMGWVIIKVFLFFVCLILLIAGGLVGFLKGNVDAIHMAILALIWFPIIEFVPKFIEKQKYITIGRILLSIPIMFLWYKTGTWTWQ